MRYAVSWGCDALSRLEFNLRYVETYHTSGLSRKQSYICTRLQAVTFQMVLIPYVLSQGLRIWHVLRFPLQKGGSKPCHGGDGVLSAYT